jgi:hypothetical protein
MAQDLSDNIAIVFNGFLALSMKEKVRLVDVLNDFFDHPDKREELRRINEQRVGEISFVSDERTCGCCRR